MAAFALTADAMGVPLPKGKFTDPKNSIEKQWRNYVAATCGATDPLNLSIYCEVKHDRLIVTVSATNRIPIIRLKPMIEKLNEAQPGLGWFVYDVIAAITKYPILRVRDIGDMAQMIWYYGADTDAAVAEEIKANDDSLDEMSLDELKESQQFAWPSDLVESVSGHAWMLGFHSDGQRRDKRTRPASADGARRFLKRRGAAPELMAIVSDALALSSELGRTDTAMCNAGLATDDLDEYDESATSIGGACLLVWDDPSLACEVLEHYETSELEGGQATDAHYTFSANPADQVAITGLIQSMKDFVQRHTVVTRMLQHFPIWKG